MSVSKAPKRKHSKSAKKNEITGIPDQEELSYLEKVVLGTGAEIFQKSREEECSDEETVPVKQKVEKKPAWVDEDDDITVRQASRKQKKRRQAGVAGTKKYREVIEEKYQQIMGVPKWSDISNKKKSPADGILERCGNFLKKPTYLDKDILDFKQLRSLNFETRTEGSSITVVKFHPKSTVALVAGNSGVASIFEVDGEKNSKIHSLRLERYPIDCGSFLRNGEEILFGSRCQKFFFCHNLITGQVTKVNNSKIIDVKKTQSFRVSPNDDLIALYGECERIHLFGVSTKEYIGSLQMNCNVTAIDFSQDGSKLYSHGEDGEVYIWDLNSRTCIKKFYDDGCITGTSISVSENDQLIACGSSSGVVNIYNNEKIQAGETLPLKSILNLVTPATTVKFNSTGEILALASKVKDNAIRLFHCPSMTTFSNFPIPQRKMGKILCVDFSPNSGFFAVGNDKGNSYLFRLKHFGNY